MNSAYGDTRLARGLVRLALYTSGFVFFMTLCTLCAHTANLTWLVLLLLAADVGVAWYAIKQGLPFEWRVERIWKTTCHGLAGLSGKGRSFRGGLKGAYIDGETKTIYPKLREVHGDRYSFTGYITAFGGQDPSDYNKVAEKYAFAFQVPSVSFEATEDGRILIRAGQIPVPQKYDFSSHVQALQEPHRTQIPTQAFSAVPAVTNNVDYRKQNVWAHVRELLRGVPVARDMNGRIFRLPIEGTHWFVAARTNGGKSSIIWSLVLGLAPARKLGLVKFYGIDPKMNELGFERGFWDEYADDDASCVELLEKCARDMHERLKHMQGDSRKITPTVATPLNVLVIDEMGYLAAYMPDKKLRERADVAVRAILAKGRSPGFACLGAVQDPRVETCGYRNMFPLRIAGGLSESKQVDMVLGEGMRELAHCEQIPFSEPGVFYVVDETTMKPVMVRAPLISDNDIKRAYAEYSRTTVNIDQLKTGDLNIQFDWNGQPLM